MVIADIISYNMSIKPSLGFIMTTDCTALLNAFLQMLLTNWASLNIIPAKIFLNFSRIFFTLIVCFLR